MQPQMIVLYIALTDVNVNLERVASRAESGGHSASEGVLRSIHRASIANLPRALRELDSVSVSDNSSFNSGALHVLETYEGRVTFVTDHVPTWLKDALKGTEFDLTELH